MMLCQGSVEVLLSTSGILLSKIILKLSSDLYYQISLSCHAVTHAQSCRHNTADGSIIVMCDG